MKTIDKNISFLVERQFPQFYREEGEDFISFVKAYYTWLEESDYGKSRYLLDYRDVDTTLDSFLIYFKEKYLDDFPLAADTDINFIVKHAKDIYTSKGSKECIELLLKLLYRTNSTVYHPSEDILRASDGEWHEPIYLELSISDRTKNFINRQITGSTSGAKAFAESVVRKSINGKYYDVIYISGLQGNFVTGEVITENGDLVNAPTVIGSLSSIDISNGGKNNAIGDVFDIVSNNGKQGKARVTSVENGTGRVDFSIADGGFGYTTNASVHVSNTILHIGNKTNSNSSITEFQFLETVSQHVANIGFISASNTFTEDTLVYGYKNSGWVYEGEGYITTLSQTGANGIVRIAVSNGNFANADRLVTVSNSITSVITSFQQANGTGKIIGYSTNTLGISNTQFIIYPGYSVRGLQSNTVANVESKSTGSGANFAVGKISNEETVYVNSDRLSGNNTSNVAYTSIALAANTYGFPKFPSGNSGTVIAKCLDSLAMTIGTISGLTSINPGSNYNENPYVFIQEPKIYGFQRKDLVLNLSNLVGSFVNGEIISQTIEAPGKLIAYTGISGNTSFELGEIVSQPASGANGYVVYKDSTTIRLQNVTGTFVATSNSTTKILGSITNAQANVSTISNTTITSIAKGIVKQANTTQATVKRISFNTNYNQTLGITGLISGATANISSYYQDESSEPIGGNAEIDAIVKTANGIATSLEILSSGFGYANGEIVTLSIDTNEFVMTGIADVNTQGRGEGYWTSTKGFLDSDKYIQDSDYYQAYSYEIQCALSLNKYANILKKLTHVAGTKMFGKVVKNVIIDNQIQSSNISITLT